MSSKLEHQRELALLRDGHSQVVKALEDRMKEAGLALEKHRKHAQKLDGVIGELQARVSEAERVPPSVQTERDQALAAVRALQTEVDKANKSRRAAQTAQEEAEAVNKDLAAEATETEKILEEWRKKATTLESQLVRLRNGEPVAV